ncbi:MAG: CRISPR-associated endonuclease Cas1 [Ardenticatenaceae bacterium]|nr:CRISPR-associated endonuclease Cas1 [Ardenticatenaceae bacterium]
MTTVYVREQGAKLQRRGERLVVSKQGQVIEEFPMNQVSQVVLMGNVQITTQTMVGLVQLNIDVAFLSSYGKFRLRLEADSSSHVQLRQKQLQEKDSGSLALPVAKAIVEAKIHNQRVILQRQVRRLEAGGRQPVYVRDEGLFERSLQGMMQMQRQAQLVDNLDSLRGYEGKAAAFYFEAIRSLLDRGWGFARRDYHPPPDPFNALLSFAYSLLLKDVRAAVNLVGLDVYMGFFHEVQSGRPSLALDLMEEWRPLLADALCLELINRGTLQPNSFVRTGNPRRPVELGEDGVAIVLQAYGSRLSTRIYHPLAGPGGETTLQQAIVLQARRLARVIAGAEPVYEGMQAK